MNRGLHPSGSSACGALGSEPFYLLRVKGQRVGRKHRVTVQVRDVVFAAQSTKTWGKAYSGGVPGLWRHSGSASPSPPPSCPDAALPSPTLQCETTGRQHVKQLAPEHGHQDIKPRSSKFLRTWAPFVSSANNQYYTYLAAVRSMPPRDGEPQPRPKVDVFKCGG